MKTEFPKLVIPNDLKFYLREVVDGKPVTTIPPGWEGVMIYHPASGQYYASKTAKPLEYEQIVRERLEPRWSGMAIALQRLLEYSPDFQFFVLSVHSRPTVENWMASNGKRRIATRMGEGSSAHRVLFEVYSPKNKCKRYAVAEFDTPKDKIIKQVNAAMALWLKSQSHVNGQERANMQVALRSRFITNTQVFEPESVVMSTTMLANRQDNEFRAICARMNLNAVKEFIQSTVTGQKQ